MSAPTRGMVAGQAIQTQAQTKEFDEGYERIFGTKKPVRGKFVYTSGGEPLAEPVQIDGDWSDAPRQPLRVDVSYMDGLQTQDGVDISSKRRRREYMHTRGVTDMSDFKDTWAKAEKERETFRRGETVDKGHREALGRAAYELSKKKGR